jgi:hypothetical protein
MVVLAPALAPKPRKSRSLEHFRPHGATKEWLRQAPFGSTRTFAGPALRWARAGGRPAAGRGRGVDGAEVPAARSQRDSAPFFSRGGLHGDGSGASRRREVDEAGRGGASVQEAGRGAGTVGGWGESLGKEGICGSTMDKEGKGEEGEMERKRK